MKTAIVVGIDPGPRKHGVIKWHGDRATNAEYLTTDGVEQYLDDVEPFDVLAIEWVNCYGRAVGADVFETAYNCGRFSKWNGPVVRIARPEVCLELVGDRRAKKPTVNRFLLDTYGPKGTMKKRGPLYGVAGHVWDALAVAVVAHRRDQS